MIIFMSDLVCVTNRTLCRENFLERLKKISACRPRAIILREKDLPAEEYAKLAESVLKICRAEGVPCILHNFFDVAEKLGADSIHLPFPELKNFTSAHKKKFRVVGVSCHSLEEVRQAESSGCSYAIVGHIFSTDCKKNLPPRGLDFLRAAVSSVKIPVWAIGGIDEKNFPLVRRAGAVAACIMSGFMRCENVAEYFSKFNGKENFYVNTDANGAGGKNF